MEKKTVMVKFDGDLEEVSVDTFVNVVAGYSRILQASAEVVEPGMKLEVKVASTRTGCLEAILTAAIENAPGLLTSLSQISGQLSTVIECGHKYLELRKFLGANGAPKQIEQKAGNVYITANDNSQVVINRNVYKLSASPIATAAAESMFDVVDDDAEIERLLISSDEAEGFSATREEFSQIQTAPACAVEYQRVDVVEKVILSVTKPVLEANSRRKWEFYWQGFKITATVEDEDFFEGMQRHDYAFGIGDCLVADLEVTKAINAVGVWQNKAFRVMKVHDVVNQGRTEQMNF